MKDKKSLYLLAIGTGLVATISLAVFYSNKTSLLNSYAGGIVHTSDKGRTLTLDSATPLVVDGEGKGRVTLGNIAAYSPECSSIANGVARIGTRGIAIYCPTAEKEDGYYKGFASSKVDRVSVTFDGSATDATVRMCWAKTDGNSISAYSSGAWNEIAISAETSNQQFTFEYDTDAFLNSQSMAKSNGKSCINIYVTNFGKTVDLVSLEVQYSCN